MFSSEQVAFIAIGSAWAGTALGMLVAALCVVSKGAGKIKTQKYNHGRQRYIPRDEPIVPVRFTNVYCNHCHKLLGTLTQQHAKSHGYKTPAEMIFLGGAEVRNG